MALARFSSGSTTNLTTLKRRDAGAWADITAIKRRSGGAWTTVYYNSTVVITDRAIDDSFSSAPARAGIRLNADGTLSKQEGVGLYTIIAGDGITGDVNFVEVRATVLSGSLTSGTTDTWLPCGSAYDWYVEDPSSAPATGDASLLLEFRNSYNQALLDSGTITLHAEAI